MARTVRELITQAARKSGTIGVTAQTALNSNEAELMLSDLNDLIEHLEAQGLWFNTRTNFTVSNLITPQYIVIKRTGCATEPDGDISMNKIPAHVASLSYMIGQQWRPLQFVSMDQLQNSVRLNIPITYPNSYAYNMVDADTGLITLYPIPVQQTYQLSVQEMKLDWALDDETDYPPGYDGYLVWAMASNFAKMGGYDYSTFDIEANKRLYVIQNRQVQARILKTGVSRGVYNIQSGLWSDGSSDFR